METRTEKWQVVGFLLLLTIGFAAQARAQEARGWIDLSVGSNQLPDRHYATNGPVAAAVGTADLGAMYSFPAGWLVEAGAGRMVNSRFGVGASVVGAHHRDLPALAVAVGGVSATSKAPTALDRFDVGVHLHALVAFQPDDARFRVRFYAGPSYFHIIQESVDDITYIPLIPTSDLRIASFTFSESDAGAWGLHAAADVSYFVTERVGLGGFVRFSRASAELEDYSGTVTAKTGGIQSGGGLRLRF